MSNLIENGEIFEGWACGLGRTDVTVEELHGLDPVEVHVPRPEGLIYSDGMPVRVLHMQNDEGGDIVQLLSA